MDRDKLNPYISALLDASLDPAVVTDAGGNILVANEAFSLLCGGPVDHLPRKHIGECIRERYPGAENQWQDVLGTVAAKGRCNGMALSLGAGLQARELVVSGTRIDLPGSQEPDLLLTIWRDETEKLRAERDLERSERFNRGLVEASPLGIVVLDAAGIVTWENPLLARVMGVPEGQGTPVIGMEVSKIPPLVEAGLLPLIERAYAGEVVNGEVARYTSLYGRKLVLDLHLAPLRDKEGSLEGVVVLVSDVTDREQVAAELRESHVTLERFMHMSPVGLGFARGRIMHRANRAMYRIFGYEPADMEGQDTRKLYATDEEYERVGQELTRQIAEEGMAVIETRMKREDGTFIDCLMQGYALHPSDPGASMVVGIMDISARKAAEEEMKRLRTAIEQADEMIVVADIEGKVVFSNPAFERMTGYSREEARGKGSKLIIGEIIEGASYDDMESVVRAGRVWHDRCTIRRRDGSRLDIEANVSPVKDRQGRLVNVVSVSRDVTREIELEGQLRHAQKMEAIGTLAGGIAHDFNNLLHAIMGFTELSMHMVPHDGKVYSNLTEVVTAARRARDLIDQVLTFARRTEQERRRMQVQKILEEAIKLLRGTLPSTIDISARIDEDCGPIMADPTQIHQVVLNLCTNAFKAMRDLGGRLDVALEEVLLEPTEYPGARELPVGRYAVLTVRDTGHGMDRQTLERIFDPYFSAWESDEGTGLGLAMVHGIVRNHGGWVDVESEPGHGTTFTVYLPVTLEKDRGEVAVEQGDALVPLAGRVLVVDDEASIVRLGELVLARMGCDVTGFTSSTEALQAFMNAPGAFDAVLTDQTMPGYTGSELARRMIELRPDLPIAIATGFSDNLTEEQARAIGVCELLPKPLGIADLERAIRRLLVKT